VKWNRVHSGGIWSDFLLSKLLLSSCNLKAPGVSPSSLRSDFLFLKLLLSSATCASLAVGFTFRDGLFLPNDIELDTSLSFNALGDGGATVGLYKLNQVDP
jgi:hypothetical protein